MPMRKSKDNRCQCCNKSLIAPFHLVFDEAGKNQNIATLLFDYIGKLLDEKDGRRYAVCSPCLQQLIQCYEFKQKCIRANESTMSEDENENEDGDEDEAEAEEEDEQEETNELNEQQSQSDSFDDSIQNEVLYEDWNESQNGSDFDGDDMNVEYLDDSFEAEIEYDPNSQILKKKLPFDFTAVLVKPVFVLDIDNPLEVMRIKQKITKGIPRHAIETRMGGAKANAQNLDVEKIATSDDLINILEDDYRNESSYGKKAREHEYTNDVDNPDGAQHTDVNDYLKSIASITYEESYDNYINCMLCTEEIISQQHLIYHISESHSRGDEVLCVFDESCPPFSDLVKVQEHIFHEHSDLIPTQIGLTCTTCDNTFKSSVQFGKHMCLTIEDQNVNFQCVNCDKKLSSKKRYMFHTQFHLENARPKVCIICELAFENEELFYNHVMFSHERVFEYFCEKCDKSFSSKLRLALHTRTHHTKRTIQCGSCDKSFVDKSMLDEHNASKHSARAQTEKSMECPVCKKVYNRSSRFRKHMTTHERLQKSSVYICEPCSMAFGAIEDIDEHCNRSHDDDNVNISKKELFFVVCCEYCEYAFVDHNKLVEHKESHLNDEKPFKCGFCMACYETYSKLKTHKNTHISQQVKFPVQRHYMCDVEQCWKRYRHWSDLLNHRKTVHLINPSIYKCNECEQTFYQSWNFSYHKKTVHSVTAVKCQECNFECKTIYTLKNHKKKAHSEETATESVEMKVKTGKLRSKKAIEIDQYLRKSDTSMVCNICGKQLATRNSATAHIEMIHFKVKNHSCEHCGKEFYLKKDFSDHKRLHTAETPYECTTCSKKFRTASMLNDHRKSHSNNRPHQCPYCASTFKRAYVLKNHIKQHIGIKGFPCAYSNCKKEYRTQWELNSHQRSKHSKPAATTAEHNDEMKFESPFEQEHSDYIQMDSNVLNLLENSKKTTKRLHSTRSVNVIDDKSIVATSKKKKKANQQIIYVMPGPEPTIEHEINKIASNHSILDKQTITFSNEDDHNYLASENDMSSDVIYVVDPQITTNGTDNIESLTTTSINDCTPTTILICHPNFSNMTIMDIGAIQTVDQEAQAIIS